MENGQKKLKELFDGRKIFNVPDYQRAYAWDESRQLPDFIEDIENQSIGRDYFLGTVLFQEKGVKQSGFDLIDIVDGQQRVTTIIIFMKVVLQELSSRLSEEEFDNKGLDLVFETYIKNKNRPKLQAISLDNDFFQNYILGDEDAIGDMDFKVTGTKNGICACQMDIKIDGLPYEVLIKALSQAREGRLHILELLDADIEAARADLKPHAPRMVKMEVARDFIGAIIGPGGKVIQGIQREHGIVMNIEEVDDHGVVTISGNNQEGVEAAIAIVKGITTVPEVGQEYDGKVEKLESFGAFVEFLPGKTGLVHISEISWHRVENLEDEISVGDSMRVKILEIDQRSGKFRLSRKVLMEKPEGYVEKPRGERRDSFSRDRRGGGRDDRRRDDRRGGGRDDRRGGRNDRRGRDDRKR